MAAIREPNEKAEVQNASGTWIFTNLGVGL